jgi:hypothetical protein
MELWIWFLSLFAIVVIVGGFVLAGHYLYEVVFQLRELAIETRAMLAGFFPKHIEDSLDKVPNDGEESFVHAPSTWDEEKMGRD